MSSNAKHGLSEGIINFLSGGLFFVLLIFGPVEPYGLVARLAYLVMLPLLLYATLTYFGDKWNITKADNDRLARSIAGIVAGVLLIGSVMAFNSNSHSVCTEKIRTYDGEECVGDYETVKGRDITGATMLLGAAGFAGWYATRRPDNKD